MSSSISVYHPVSVLHTHPITWEGIHRPEQAQGRQLIGSRTSGHARDEDGEGDPQEHENDKCVTEDLVHADRINIKVAKVSIGRSQS